MCRSFIVICLLLIASDSFSQKLEPYSTCAVDLSSIKEVLSPKFLNSKELVAGDTYYFDRTAYSNFEFWQNKRYSKYFSRLVPKSEASSKQISELESAKDGFFQTKGSNTFYIGKEGLVYNLDFDVYSNFARFFSLPIEFNIKNTFFAENDQFWGYHELAEQIDKEDFALQLIGQPLEYLGEGQHHLIFKGTNKYYIVSNVSAQQLKEVFLPAESHYSNLVKEAFFEKTLGDKVYSVFNADSQRVKVLVDIEEGFHRTFYTGSFQSIVPIKLNGDNIDKEEAYLKFSAENMFGYDVAFFPISQLDELYFMDSSCMQQLSAQIKARNDSLYVVMRDASKAKEDSMKIVNTAKRRSEDSLALFSCSLVVNEIDKIDGKERLMTDWIKIPIKEQPYSEEHYFDFEYKALRVGNKIFMFFRYFGDLGCLTSSSKVTIKFTDGSIVSLYHIGDIDCSSMPAMQVELSSEQVDLLKRKKVELIRMYQNDAYGDATVYHGSFLSKMLLSCLK